jgi:hypothetical protein
MLHTFLKLVEIKGQDEFKRLALFRCSFKMGEILFVTFQPEVGQKKVILLPFKD